MIKWAWLIAISGYEGTQTIINVNQTNYITDYMLVLQNI